MNKICPVCGGILSDKIIQIDFRYKDQLVVIDNVPTQVCGQCGEKLISSEISRDIDILLEAESTPAKSVIVPVYPYRHSKAS